MTGRGNERNPPGQFHIANEDGLARHVRAAYACISAAEQLLGHMHVYPPASALPRENRLQAGLAAWQYGQTILEAIPNEHGIRKQQLQQDAAYGIMPSLFAGRQDQTILLWRYAIFGHAETYFFTAERSDLHMIEQNINAGRYPSKPAVQPSHLIYVARTICEELENMYGLSFDGRQQTLRSLAKFTLGFTSIDSSNPNVYWP